MAVDERARHDLYLKLEQVLGPGEATTLMEHLPPVGWGDVATKRDLDQLAVATKRDLDHLKMELTANFRGELIAQTRTMIFAMTGAVMTAVGLALAAVRLV